MQFKNEAERVAWTAFVSATLADAPTEQICAAKADRMLEHWRNRSIELDHAVGDSISALEGMIADLASRRAQVLRKLEALGETSIYPEPSKEG